MKKSIIVVSALFLAASSAAVLCACGGGEKGTTEVAFASYESWQDGFYNINMMDGFGRISRSDEQAHGGSYSAKLQPLGSVTDPSAPYFYYPMQMDGEEGYSFVDFSKLAKVSFYMYNAGSETEEVQLAVVASISDVYSTDYKVVGSYSLTPGEWTKVEYTPDYEGLQDLCDITNVAGLGFVFENQHSASVALRFRRAPRRDQDERPGKGRSAVLRSCLLARLCAARKRRRLRGDVPRGGQR